MPRYLLINLICVLGAFGYQAKAQSCGADAANPISTDRPQITNSSVVVPCGSLQLENGFLVTTPQGDQQGFDLPETSVRFGVARKIELRFAAPDYFYNDAASGYTDGFGDLILGFKQQLGPTLGFDVSLIPSMSWPAGANAISSHGYDPALQLPWSRGFAKDWTVAGMFSMLWPTESGRRNLSGQSSVYVDRQITKPLDAYLEYSGTFPQRGGPQHVVDFGAAYKLSLHQQLDFHWSFALSGAAPDHSIGLGYSIRFQVIRHR